MLKVSESLSTYTNSEFLQIKNTKFVSNTSGKSAKNFEFFFRVLWGKVTSSSFLGSLPLELNCDLFKNAIRHS